MNELKERDFSRLEAQVYVVRVQAFLEGKPQRTSDIIKTMESASLISAVKVASSRRSIGRADEALAKAGLVSTDKFHTPCISSKSINFYSTLIPYQRNLGPVGWRTEMASAMYALFLAHIDDTVNALKGVDETLQKRFKENIVAIELGDNGSPYRKGNTEVDFDYIVRCRKHNIQPGRTLMRYLRSIGRAVRNNTTIEKEMQHWGVLPTELNTILQDMLDIEGLRQEEAKPSKPVHFTITVKHTLQDKRRLKPAFLARDSSS